MSHRNVACVFFLCLKGSDKLLTFFKDAGLDGKAGWQLFKEKDYLGKLDNQKEVEKLLEQYILRFERDPKEEPELSRFHLFDAKGNVKGIRDMEIVDYLVENVQFLWWESHLIIMNTAFSWKTMME